MSDATVQQIVGIIGVVLVLWAISGFPAFWRKPYRDEDDDE